MAGSLKKFKEAFAVLISDANSLQIAESEIVVFKRFFGQIGES